MIIKLSIVRVQNSMGTDLALELWITASKAIKCLPCCFQ